MKNLKSLLDDGARALELPPEVSGTGCRLELRGRRTLLIDNHRGVRECDAERITLRSNEGELTVRGRELQLAEMNAESLLIEGFINSLSWAEDNHGA